MKLSKTFEGFELPSEVTQSLQKIYIDHIDELVEGYDARLVANGNYLPDDEKDRLRKYLKHDLAVKLSVSASITEKKLEDWHIHSVSINQQIFAMSEEDQT